MLDEEGKRLSVLANAEQSFAEKLKRRRDHERCRSMVIGEAMKAESALTEWINSAEETPLSDLIKLRNSIRSSLNKLRTAAAK